MSLPTSVHPRQTDRHTHTHTHTHTYTHTTAAGLPTELVYGEFWESFLSLLLHIAGLVDTAAFYFM